MREIKFRAKRVDKEEFAFGDLLTGMGYKKGKFFILPHLSYYPSDCHSVDGYEVKPETIGQYTGLKDKNGKEIYEGDIIRYTDTDSFVVNPDCDPWLHFSRSYAIVREEVVVFEDGMFCNDEGHPICYLGWESIKDLRECLDIPDGEDCDVDGTIINESLLGIEVIGNIYDNPELLTK